VSSWRSALPPRKIFPAVFSICKCARILKGQSQEKNMSTFKTVTVTALMVLKNVNWLAVLKLEK
jgi:hypothetical protein